MKHLNIKSKFVRLISGLSIVAVAFTALAAAPVGVAFADTPTPTPKPGQAARTARLEKVYQREQNWLTQQQANLTKATAIATKVQDFINAQNAKGKDTTALQQALAVFQQQLATAQSAHQAAAATILSNHTGFDANGKVTDAAQARQTLIDARQSLRDAHQALMQGTRDLHRAIREYRTANKK
jgi:hypothetical protein